MGVIKRLVSSFEGDIVQGLIYELENTIEEIKIEGTQMAFGWYKPTVEKLLS